MNYTGLRGYFEEGYRGDCLQGSYINGVYERRMLPRSGYRGMLPLTEFMVNTVDWVYTRIICNGVTIDMGEATAMGAVQIQLNPNAIWAARTQEVEIQISDDGENFNTIFAKTTLSFDPKENNSAYVKFDAPVESQYIRFVFYSNTEASAGQAAEIAVYAP